MTWTIVLLFIGGGACLVAGAESLVRGAARLATSAGVSPLVVGLTVVAFGTSSPELAVTVGAAISGQADVAVGNVVGSNILNVLFILGVSALVAPLVVAQQLVRLDVPLMIAVSVIAWLLALDGRIGRLNGVLLFAGIVVYTVFLIRQSRRETTVIRAEYAEAFGEAPAKRAPWILHVLLVVGGLVLLVIGSRWLVEAAVAMATSLGVSQLVIGLTIVAAGTSLPEVATSVLASLRGERDIAVGNVVGSNLFNLLAVLGLGSIVAPRGIPVAAGALSFDFPVMIAVAVATLPIFFTGVIARWQGLLFLAYYIAYIALLVLAATQHVFLAPFRAAMVWFALPLTALTLALLVVRARRTDGAGRGRTR